MKIDAAKVQTNLKSAGFSPGPIDGIFAGRSIAALLSYAAGSDLGDFATKAGQICATMFPKYGIMNAVDPLVQFVANTAHETGDYSAFAENLSYTSPAAIVATWPSRFTLLSAALYLRQPQKLAEKVYGGRFGNPPGMAYAYRGGGWIQTTFYANYKAAQDVTGLPLVAHPELLHDPLTSIEAACAYWKNVGCNELATIDPTGQAARMKVNGGTIGLVDVRARVKRLRTIF